MEEALDRVALKVIADMSNLIPAEKTVLRYLPTNAQDNDRERWVADMLEQDGTMDIGAAMSLAQILFLRYRDMEDREVPRREENVQLRE